MLDGGVTMTPLPIARFSTEADERLNAWRAAHQAATTHLHGCRACGAALCDDGQLLWDTADLTERRLPWRSAIRVMPAQFTETEIAESDRLPFWLEMVALIVVFTFLLACVALGWAIAKGGLI
jgi:hypothetical protein